MSLDVWYDAYETWCTDKSFEFRKNAVREFDDTCGIVVSKQHMDKDDRWFWFAVQDAKKFACACLRWGWTYT